MSFTFLENAFDSSEKPFLAGSGGPPSAQQQMAHGGSQGNQPTRMSTGGFPNSAAALSEMSHYPPPSQVAAATAYGAPRAGGMSNSPPPPYHSQPSYTQPRHQPISSGAPMDYQEVSPSQHQQQKQQQQQEQQEYMKQRHYEQLYAMGKFETKQQETNAMVLRSMKQYASSLEILLFIVIAFCVVMVIVQIVICRKMMTLTKMNQINNN